MLSSIVRNPPASRSIATYNPRQCCHSLTSFGRNLCQGVVGKQFRLRRNAAVSTKKCLPTSSINSSKASQNFSPFGPRLLALQLHADSHAFSGGPNCFRHRVTHSTIG